jgi:hypothetical protein
MDNVQNCDRFLDIEWYTSYVNRCSSETSIHIRTKRRYLTEDDNRITENLILVSVG